MLYVMFSEENEIYFGKVSIFNCMLALFSMLHRSPLQWRYIRIHRLYKNQTDFYKDYKFIYWRIDKIKFIPKKYIKEQAINFDLF